MVDFYVPSDRSVCLDLAQRQERSFDFLACEGYHGWPATHAMFPFVLMLFINDAPKAWLASGLVEIFEALFPALFGSVGLFSVNPSNYETLAGSVVGDWLINDFLGVLAAALLLRLLGVPGLAEAWYSRSWPGTKDRPAAWSGLWWRVHAFFVVVMAQNAWPIWVTPAGCDWVEPYACTNVGLIISVASQLALVALGGLWLLRGKEAERHIWRPGGASRRRVSAFFGFWFCYILLVGAQNAQPAVPVWFFPLIGEWAQVWLAAGVWMFAVVVYYLAATGDSYQLRL